MADLKIILTKEDVEKYRDISNNFNQNRFDTFASEVQLTPLRELLGDALYYELYNDLDAAGEPKTGKYEELVDGATYEHDGDTVLFFGLIPFMVYHWLAINIREGNLFQADYGNLTFTNSPQDNMQSMSKAEKDSLNAAYMKNITSYRNNIVQFLNENDSTYETWEGRRENKPKSGFNSFTV